MQRLSRAATRIDGAKMLLEILSASVSVTAKAAFALSMTTSSPFLKVGRRWRIIARFFKQGSIGSKQTEDVGTDQLKGYSCDIKFTDKELDIIEMAVYGEVIRPGNYCRCKTIAEMLGKHKPKDNTNACQLP